MLVLPGDGDRMLDVYDPATGRVDHLRRDTVVERRLGLSGWDVPWVAVRPTGLRTRRARRCATPADFPAPAPAPRPRECSTEVPDRAGRVGAGQAVGLATGDELDVAGADLVAVGEVEDAGELARRAQVGLRRPHVRESGIRPDERHRRHLGAHADLGLGLGLAHGGERRADGA